MKTADQWATYLRRNLSDRSGFGLLSDDAVWKEMEAAVVKMFSDCQRDGHFWGAREQREKLPEQLRSVIERAYDVVFDIITNPPATVAECEKKLLDISPMLHAARYPSMHG